MSQRINFKSGPKSELAQTHLPSGSITVWPGTLEDGRAAFYVGLRPTGREEVCEFYLTREAAAALVDLLKHTGALAPSAQA